MQKTILIVDDEEHILELLRYNLEINKYNVVQAETGEEALNIIENNKNTINCVILDWMLPDIDGIEVLKKIRFNSKFKSLPVIMLTAKREEFDTVLGLEIGADDYLGKPFSIRELLARIKSVLRRSQSIEEKDLETSDKKIIIDNIVINENFRTVYKDNQLIDMTLKEYELLLTFVKNPGRVFSREYLLEKVWGYDFLGETRTVDVHIRSLRKKIEEDDANPKFIKTVRGVGYKFKEAQQ